MQATMNAHFENGGDLSFSGMQHPECQSVVIKQGECYGDVTLFLAHAQIEQLRDHLQRLAGDNILAERGPEHDERDYRPQTLADVGMCEADFR